APTAQAPVTPTLSVLYADGITSLAGGIVGATHACFVAPAAETVFFKVIQAEGSPRSHLLSVSETTLWANWFYIGGDYSSYILLRNTIAADIHATITWRGDTGAPVGTESVTIPPGGVVYRDARVKTD